MNGSKAANCSPIDNVDRFNMLIRFDCRALLPKYTTHMLGSLVRCLLQLKPIAALKAAAAVSDGV